MTRKRIPCTLSSRVIGPSSHSGSLGRVRTLGKIRPMAFFFVHGKCQHYYESGHPRQSPGLGYKRVVSCKDSFHGTDVLAGSEHGAPGRRPNIHAHFVGRQREDGLDTLPARAAEANRSTLIADIPFPAPENVAAKRCASEKRAF